MPSPTIKAIETHYAGCRFRSRLEARWAVFFDTLGIRWEYEPQGYELDDGTRYLPDFWLPEVPVYMGHKAWEGIYVEVKGDDASLWSDDEKLGQMIEGGPMRETGLLILGPVPRTDMLEVGQRVGHWALWNRKGPEAGVARWTCAHGSKAMLSGQWAASCYPMPPEVSTQAHVTPPPPGRASDEDEFMWSGYFGQVHRAYTAARSARFEHGESG